MQATPMSAQKIDVAGFLVLFVCVNRKKLAVLTAELIFVLGQLPPGLPAVPGGYVPVRGWIIIITRRLCYSKDGRAMRTRPI